MRKVVTYASFANRLIQASCLHCVLQRAQTKDKPLTNFTGQQKINSLQIEFMYKLRFRIYAYQHF